MKKGKIFCVCNQKGGCGKTTLSMHLAGELSLKNKKCVVVDADVQNSALEWYNLNDKMKLPFSVVDFSSAGVDLYQKVYELIFSFDYIIIDCPPAANSEIMFSALIIADLALIPFIASGIDMLALITLYKKIQEVRKKNTILKVRIVLNMLEDRTQNTKKILGSITEFGVPVLNTSLRKRTIFKDAVIDGSLVQFLKKRDKGALLEINKITEEILNMLK